MSFFRYHVGTLPIKKLVQFSYKNCTNWRTGHWGTDLCRWVELTPTRPSFDSQIGPCSRQHKVRGDLSRDFLERQQHHAVAESPLASANRHALVARPYYFSHVKIKRATRAITPGPAGGCTHLQALNSPRCAYRTSRNTKILNHLEVMNSQACGVCCFLPFFILT